MQAKVRPTDGSIAVIVSNSRLQLRFSYGGKRHYLSTGFSDTKEGRKAAEARARQIELDITSDNFDPSLAKYKPQSALTTIAPISTPSLNLLELWDRYSEFKATQVEATTLKLNFDRVKSHISKLPTKTLENAITIRDYLLANNSTYTAKRVLIQLCACCKWGVKSRLIFDNPFEGMAAEIKQSKSESVEGDIDPFTREERNVIIQAFSDHPTYSHYTSFVKFLFMTGCRTSEAVGLKWKHISADCSRITFSEAVVNVSSKKIRKGLKNQEKRTFPCNQSLKLFLQSIKLKGVEPDSPIFTSIKGQEINAHTFNAMCWHGCDNKGKHYVGMALK